MIPRRWPQVRYLRLERNSGPSAARNWGLRKAANPWVLMLDDDDQLLPNALRCISETIEGFRGHETVPVFQFAVTNGALHADFMVVGLEDYLEGRIRGDFTPVIQRSVFLSAGYAYPDSPVGSEHLLWWELALRSGIPTFAGQVVRLNSDAPDRLTSGSVQIQKAKFHAISKDETLHKFGDLLYERARAVYDREWLGSAVYHLLAGQPTLARKRLRSRPRARSRLLAVGLVVLSYFPVPFVRWLFAAYRQRQTLRGAGGPLASDPRP